jgi:hydroxymethylpyrimidine pyrophosphatase-like HAD family hydrolase
MDQIVSFYVPDTTPENVQKIMKAFENHPRLTTNRMLGKDLGTESVEVINSKATKQFGIYEVAKLLKIETHEIIGVGDGYNDFPLLMACGLKVAMGNAVPELKAIADFIAPSVQEDGLATVIEKFILEK